MTSRKAIIGIIIPIPFVLIVMSHISPVLASQDLTNVTIVNLTESKTDQYPSIESLRTNQTLSVPDMILQRILSNANQSLNALENDDLEIAKVKINSVYEDLKEIALNRSTSQG